MTDTNRANRRIAVVTDLDGVLANFHKGYAAIAAPRFEVDLTAEPTQWDFGLGVRAHELMEDIFSDSSYAALWDRLEPYEGIAQIAALNPVMVTTHRPEYARFVTLVWLKRHEFEVPSRTLLKLATAHERLHFLAALAPVYYLDDSPATVKVAETVPGVMPYLLDKPWNRKSAHELGIRRCVASLEDFARLVNEAQG